MTPEHAHTNRLIDETSPYLLQHAHNPVDWYPWGDDALQKARRNDKPIFLSIGYSACHWCHVMERESFENETIAGALNDHFVPIKVDREERPDLDNLYMNAVQVMTGQGGWPMSVWLTPELEPFYAGTYFPPEDRYGRPGFSSVIDQVADAWQDDRDTVEQVGERIRAKLAAMEDAGQPARALTREPVDRAFGQLDDTFDADHGGFGDAPKFPPTQQLRLLLHVWGDLNADDDRRQRAVEMVETTLVHMASGGMYDQLGGGFHRYSVDQKWLIPHFEKMLYDNALLAEVYVEAWQATGRDFYRRIATETLDYVLAEMTGESTGAGRPFYSTQDADTDGHEGRFFVWTPDELADALGVDDGLRAAEYWGVTDAGNFEDGLCALNRLAAVDDRGIEAAFEPRPAHIDDLRQRLLEARRGRSAPGTDTKVLAAWNAMMISALARAGWAFEMPRYISAAEDAADFILADMIDGELDDDFQLMRTFKDGRARLPGYLDDFAHLGAALIDLFEATGDRHRLAQAEAIVDRMVQLFADDDKGGFYSTGEHHRDLIVRQKQSHDGATPSGNAIALTDCLRLAELRGRDDLRQRAAEGLRAFFGEMTKIPTGMAEMIQALDFQVEGPAQIVVVVPDGADAKAIDDVLRTSFVPNAVRARIELAAADADTWAGAVPLSRARTPVDDQPTVYVCFEGACQRPITDADALADLLG